MEDLLAWSDIGGKNLGCFTFIYLYILVLALVSLMLAFVALKQIFVELMDAGVYEVF
jgi:hypothetical protein